MKLKRNMSPVAFLFCIIGAIIGSGWLLGPFFAAKIAGPAAMLSWVIGGIMMMVILLSYAELCTLLPIAGGTTRYLQFSHGTLASFTIGWITWLATVPVGPIETLAILHYASNYLPWLMANDGGAGMLSLNGFLIAAVLLFIMTVINVFGAQLLAKTNNVIVFFKLLVPILTLVILFSIGFHPANLESHGFSPMGWKGVLTALPAAGVVFSLMGCHAALQFAGEVRNPQRSIPLCIMAGLLICTCLYVLLQLAFVAALNPHDFRHGWASLSFAGDMGPFVGLTAALGAIWLTKILFIDAIISPYGCALVYTGAAARLTYALAENGYFPHELMKLNSFGVSVRILTLNYIAGLLLFLPFPTWQAMMSFLVSALILGYAVGPLALNVFRKSMKHRKRPFRVPFPQVTSYLGFYFCNLIILWTGWSVISKMMIAILLGYGILAWYKLRASQEKFPLHLEHGWWLFPYIAGMGLLSYLCTFGGGLSLIPFGWDFVAVAILSLIIYIFAQRGGLDKDEYREIIDAELREVL